MASGAPRISKRQFREDPNRIITHLISDYVETSEFNRLKEFNNAPIFDNALVGFADGNDDIFPYLRNVVHPDHMLPREVMAREFGQQFTAVTVVSFVLPINIETRKANAREEKGPSLRWNHTRWHGQAFITSLSWHLVTVLTDLGVPAVAPELTPSFAMVTVPGGFASFWSQRHIAYAAGLGTFGLSGALITAHGVAMRCGSVVVAGSMEITHRQYDHPHAHCLFYGTGKCGKCMKRCPRGAITTQGLDKRRCYEILTVDQRPWLNGQYGPGYIGKYAGCGLCQTGVPCEGGVPHIDHETA